MGSAPTRRSRRAAKVTRSPSCSAARAPPKPPRAAELEVGAAAILDVDTGETVEAVHDPQRRRGPPTMPQSWAAAAAQAPREHGAAPSCRECDAPLPGVREAEARAGAAEQRAAAAEAAAASARGRGGRGSARARLGNALARQRGDQAVICKLDDEALCALEKEQRAALDRVVEEPRPAQRSSPCVVCHERPRERAPPCGHCCVCGECSTHGAVANVCPVCRSAARDRRRVPVKAAHAPARFNGRFGAAAGSRRPWCTGADMTVLHVPSRQDGLTGPDVPFSGESVRELRLGARAGAATASTLTIFLLGLNRTMPSFWAYSLRKKGGGAAVTGRCQHREDVDGQGPRERAATRTCGHGPCRRCGPRSCGGRAAGR